MRHRFTLLLLLAAAAEGINLMGRMPMKRLNDAADMPHLAEHKLREHAETGSGSGLIKDSSDPSAHCTDAQNDVHIVFSTGCNAFQHWQAETLLNAAYHAGQCGKITRIVVGCDKHVNTGRHKTHQGGDADRLITNEDLLKSSHPRVNIHIAPAIPEAKDFPWFNKPWSFHHWLLEQGDSITETAIVILDPDEFFLRPLTTTGRAREDMLSHWPKSMDDQITDVVRPGMAVAQMYGFGSVWVNMFDYKHLCPGGEASPCAKITHEVGSMYYPAGPPYILHNTDFRKVMPLWWDLMKPVYAADKGDIQADMYAYVYAAIHHDIKHTILYDYMLSNVDMGNVGEAWDYIDGVKELSCDVPVLPEGMKRPGFVHAAGHYKACTNGDTIDYNTENCPTAGGELWNWHKGHVPSQIMGCEHPLIMPPPDDLYNVQIKTGTRRGQRTAFMICSLTYLVNRAALDYKKKFCPAGYNTKKCTRLVTNHRSRQAPQGKNPFNYPLAKVVC